jgi:hypothetical protein
MINKEIRGGIIRRNSGGFYCWKIKSGKGVVKNDLSRKKEKGFTVACLSVSP